jgi:hypothetical protein
VYTLDSQIAFSITGASGTIDAYDPLLDGPINYAADGICLAGVCGGPTQDWILFRVTVTSGSLDQVGVGALFASSVGAGYFNIGGGTPDNADITTVPTTPVFNFTTTALTGTSAPLFVAYPDGLPTAGGGPFGPGSTQFMVQLGGAADAFLGTVTTVVPEPGTVLLLGAGFLGLGVIGRRQRG